MTTTITGTTGTFYMNNPPENITGTFYLKSQYSQDNIQAGNAYTVVTQNDRYAQIDVTFVATFKDKHYNGYYTWSIGSYSDIVKIITQPGGDTGTVDYISDNEEREADTYYRPNY